MVIHTKQCVGSGAWTVAPGAAMETSTEQSGYQWKYTWMCKGNLEKCEQKCEVWKVMKKTQNKG